MCKSAADGGQRCAHHTRPAYAQVVAEFESASRFSRGKVRAGRVSPEMTNQQAIINYATTKEGKKEVPALLAKFEAERDMQTVQWMKTALRAAAQQAEVNKAVAAEYRLQAQKTKRAATKSKSPLSRSKKPMAGRMAVRFPELSTMWHPTKNVDHRTGEVLTAMDVDGGSNADIHYLCPEGHEFVKRGNNVTAPFVKHGKILRCPECNGRRTKSLQAMQEDLTAFVNAVDGDPDAWESLSPAARYAILHANGMLSGSAESFQRATAMAMIGGDLTLREVMAARSDTALERTVERVVGREGMGEDDENTKTIDVTEESPLFDDGKFGPDDQDTRLEQVMSSAGAIALVGSNEALAEQIMRENVQKLWNEVYTDESQAEAILAKIKKGAEKNEFRARLAAEFEEDLRRVQNTPLPEGYNNVLTLANGQSIEINPTLAQRRFMLAVEDRRVYGNWSGTGAGKTLAGVLAVAHTGAQESMVVCPQSVVSHWKAEFERAYPDTEIRTELPDPGEDLDATRDGRRRVWVLNYDKFSAQTTKGEPTPAERMASLAERLDATVLDEVHKAKSTDEKTESKRRKVLDGILNTAREANPDLAVMPTTATPVVTSLVEAKSILSLAYGKAPAGMGTQPTLKNAAFAYQALSAAGTRFKPAYKPTLTRAEARVDITANVSEVLGRMDRHADALVDAAQARYDALPELEKRRRKPFSPEAARKRALSMPSTMERALLPERLPRIVEEVRNADGPTVVYTRYTDGIADPIVDRLRSEGITAARFTGKESLAERTALIKKFQNGEVHVLVGSSAIGTGVDGLQRVSRNMVVASMDWTAADDEQLVGRLHRTGQTEHVTVKYIKTEVDLGEGQKWSYCDGRYNRIQFRRSLADAAVDGKMPEGQLGSQEDQVANAVAKMRSLVAPKSEGLAQAA